MSNRIGYIDVTKGITILLVIVGHVEELPNPIKSIIYSFHMPIFFLLSGYFFKEETLQNATKKMFHSLIIPYFVVGVFMRLCHITINYFGGNSFDYIDVLSLFGVTWKFGRGVDLVSVGAIWFLVVLFWSKLYLQLVLRSKYSFLLLLLLANGSIFIKLVFGVVLPFGIQQALVCSLFVYAGAICKKYGMFEKKIPTTAFVFFFLTAIPFAKSFAVATRANSYSNGMMSIVISTIISVMVVFAVKKLCDYKCEFLSNILPWCGRFSIIILAVHSIEARYICGYIPFPNWSLEILVRIIYVLIVSYFCVKIGFIRKLFNIKDNY